MDLEVSYTFENEQQYWDELDEVLSLDCNEHALIDNALRSYLFLATRYWGEYITTEDDITRCSYRLLQSRLFSAHEEYVRRQIVHSLIQEDASEVLHCIAAILIHDGRRNEAAFAMMNTEGAFTRLRELIQEKKEEDQGLHRMLIELLYEMSSIQRVRREDLSSIEDDFIMYLFQIIESSSSDVHDPYHYPVIRVLLVLNEQYMVCANDHSSASSATPLGIPTNRVIKVLARHGAVYKSFGQNIILLLNRESETLPQLLILKLLYLLFTSEYTCEYFYTNDLHVLLDIILRNLLDLPISETALRHTYLRVLSPFLSQSQLRYPPHYKHDDILRLLTVLSDSTGGHFGTVDETTKRLVERCSKVEWLNTLGCQADVDNGVDLNRQSAAELRSGVGSISQATESSLSVVEIACQTNQPGLITPSMRRRGSTAEPEDAHESPFDTVETS